MAAEQLYHGCGLSYLRTRGWGRHYSPTLIPLCTCPGMDHWGLTLLYFSICPGSHAILPYSLVPSPFHPQEKKSVRFGYQYPFPSVKWNSSVTSSSQVRSTGGGDNKAIFMKILILEPMYKLPVTLSHTTRTASIVVRTLGLSSEGLRFKPRYGWSVFTLTCGML